MIVTSDAILDVIAEETGADRATLQPSTTLESAGVASLDLISAIFTLEDRFGVIVETEDVKDARTLQDFIDVVMAKAATAT